MQWPARVLEFAPTSLSNKMRTKLEVYGKKAEIYGFHFRHTVYLDGETQAQNEEKLEKIPAHRRGSIPKGPTKLVSHLRIVT
jgi:hypothetical protein